MDSLPTELQQQILFDLDYGDLARLRRTCSIYRDIVEDSLQYIAEQKCKLIQARLRSYVAHHLDWAKGDVDFFSALKRLCRHHRGVLETDHNHAGIAATFTALWMEKQYGIDLRQFPEWSIHYGYLYWRLPPVPLMSLPPRDPYLDHIHDVALMMEGLTQALVQIHIQHHLNCGVDGLWPYGLIPPPHELAQRIYANYQYVLERELQVDEFKVMEWCEELAMKGFETAQDLTGLDEERTPRFVLTRLDISRRLRGRCFEHGIVTLDKLQQIVGDLPALPGNSWFAWCVKEKWAYDKILQVVESGGELAPLLKAAILEDIFVY